MANNDNHLYTNKLSEETSPYLLQHAHNPVQWYPWGVEALDKAKKENKLILVSIGYSACHWCHVMERESFESEDVAGVMNENFICIKVDREERPDIDQVYMSAVQLMTGSGGWPLNCIALPDGRPIYGGTYFRKDQWVNILNQLADFYKNEKDKAYEYAEQLVEGIKQFDVVKLNKEGQDFSIDILHNSVKAWSSYFDKINGGNDRAPKFPLPNNFICLLRYGHLTRNKGLQDFVNLSLKKMAYGGIYDQVGGGFARYSTDTLWKVPHFEKMLYDNAQLVSLYCEAFRLTKKQLYKNIVYETCEFIKNEMTSAEGVFYSALDADSEGVEGKYYVWNEKELRNILNEDYNLFANYFNVNQKGYWEHDNYILLRDKDDDIIAKENNISVDELINKMKIAKEKLLAERGKRIRPGLDDKSLTSWNALMLKAYAEAYETFNENVFLEAALANADFIIKKQWRKDGGLNHSYKKERSTINGYLEDYAFTIEAFIALYKITFDEQWLEHSKKLLEYTIEHFYDKNTGMFWFTSDLDAQLIVRKMEVADNVIPSSNSSIARSIFELGLYFDNKDYTDMSGRMLNNVTQQIVSYGSGYSNWAILMLNYVMPFYEIAVVGELFDERTKELFENYIPNAVISGCKVSSELPLLKDKASKNRTLIFVCKNKSCQLPVEFAKEAMEQVKY